MFAPRLLLVVPLLATALSGCLGDGQPSGRDVGLGVEPFPSLALGGAAGSALDGVRWTGKELRSDRPYGPATVFSGFLSLGPQDCTEASCERIEFALDVPEGYWRDRDGWLEIAIRIEPSDAHEAMIRLAVEGADGAALAAAPGFYAVLLRVAEPASGTYAAVAQAYAGATSYEGLARLVVDEPFPGELELLPNLVTLPIRDVRVAVPKWGNLPGYEALAPPSAYDAAANAAGQPGCAPDEIEPGEPKKCLRLSNAIGNVGLGPLEVHLAAAEWPKTVGATGGSGQFVQRIYRGDGSYREVPAADSAFFHPSHMHFHYDGIAEYGVFRYDLETRTRGEPLNAGSKAGFCLGDEGLVALDASPSGPGFYGAGCFLPLETQSFFMGLTPGWFDGYETYRTDQYVDISAAEDGVYELVSTANPERSLLESDYADNEASVLFRLTGDEVELLA